MESVDAWRYDAPDLAGPYPRCDAFSLGQLAHSCDLGIVRVEPADDPLDLPEDAVVEFVTWAAPDVAAALLADLGTEVLFASLYASSRANVAFPLSAELFAEVVEDLSADKLAGHSWVREGLPL
ncbi:MAG TPA: hypothetical protein VHD81_00870 [Mycobacteriales bacterium]|nr:hypothetical protein [Mycobacteriales bacterium]